MKIYMRTTTDQYEFPVAIGTSPGELARKMKTTERSVLSSLAHKSQGWYRIEVDEEDEMLDLRIQTNMDIQQQE